MFYIVLYDYLKDEQKILGKTAYKDNAIDFCEEKAYDIVFEKEGLQYLKRHNNDYHHKGYSLTKKKNSFVVYHKEPNTILFTGKLTKVFKLFIVKVPLSFKQKYGKKERRESKMNDMNYDTVLNEMQNDPKYKIRQVEAENTIQV